MKKIILILITTLFITSCSLDNLFQEKQIIIGKHETPNGTEFTLIKQGTGYLFQDNKGKISNNSFTSTGEIIKDLNEKNPFYTSLFTDIFGNQFIIDNYKGFHITDEKGVKIDKIFTTKEQSIQYIESLYPPTCDVTIKKFVNQNNISELIEKEEVEKYINKYRVISFKTLTSCNGDIVKEHKGAYGFDFTSKYKYSFLDTFTTIAGFGGYDMEEPEKSETIKVANNGVIYIDEYVNGRYYISLGIYGINISFGHYSNPIYLEKEKVGEVVKELKLISNTIKINSEDTQFDVNNITINDKFWGPTNENIDRQKSYFNYESKTIVLVSNNIEKIVTLKITDDKQKSFQISDGNNIFITPFDIGIMQAGYKIEKVIDEKIHWKATGFKDRKDITDSDGFIIDSIEKTYVATYITDINSGITFIEKIEEQK